MKISSLVKIILSTVVAFICLSPLSANIDIRPIVNIYNGCSLEVLLEKGEKYHQENKNDTALILFRLVEQRFSSNVKHVWSDEDKEKLITALQTSGKIYFSYCNYNKTLDFFLKALAVAEELNHSEYLAQIYNGIGNVYSAFKDYTMAEKYYFKSYSYARNENTLSTAYNNLGAVYICLEEYDKAVDFLERACLQMKRQNDVYYYKPLSNLGLACHRRYYFKEALNYYEKGLLAATEGHVYTGQASILSNIGQLHYDAGNYEMASSYLLNSISTAKKHDCLLSVIDNYKYLSLVEERKHNYKKSLEYNRTYINLNDSIYHFSTYSSINQKQFIYDMSKIDSQMKVLSTEYILKENEIIMQRRISLAMILILISIATFCLILFKKNHTLNKAYVKLVEKNMLLVKMEEYNRWLRIKNEGLQIIDNTLLHQEVVNKNKVEEISNKKIHPLTPENKAQLIDAIEKLMEHSEVFCDPDFSLDILAEKVHSNSNYVSHVINECYGKNFRTFINEYRIKEAVRMLSLPEYTKYSLETISEMVGFKSKATFYKLFSKIVGVTPSFYLKSIQSKGNSSCKVL